MKKEKYKYIFKLTYEECKLTFKRIYTNGGRRGVLDKDYYCKSLCNKLKISLNKHKEILDHYDRFVKELEEGE
ncbi:hypothetical protein H9660_03615 [Clostridium sp. Sa3CUN1]|uniref:Uncharacterized protein n=1 Tax=Clostridium gallinarum TaxID=2762246 RepID=A0ABR8Q1C9_9CLOT|nr:hypothetical protein [Clostridium gallinarum]MBD7914226.1 hypothetical protein [Clostridium gallinarum]